MCKVEHHFSAHCVWGLSHFRLKHQPQSSPFLPPFPFSKGAGHLNICATLLIWGPARKRGCFCALSPRSSSAECHSAGDIIRARERADSAHYRGIRKPRVGSAQKLYFDYLQVIPMLPDNSRTINHSLSSNMYFVINHPYYLEVRACNMFLFTTLPLGISYNLR